MSSKLPLDHGITHGGGGRRGPMRYVDDDTPWTHLPMQEMKRIREKVPDFDPDEKYTLNQLNLLTEKILLLDPKHCTEEPMWLNGKMYKERTKREIYVASGSPDPSIVSGLYNRTHPRGRKANTDPTDRAAKGASFYR